jgi:hypothetical protein
LRSRMIVRTAFGSKPFRPHTNLSPNSGPVSAPEGSCRGRRALNSAVAAPDCDCVVYALQVSDCVDATLPDPSVRTGFECPGLRGAERAVFPDRRWWPTFEVRTSNCPAE